MDEQTLTRRIKALNKAIASDPPSVVVGLLEELKKDPAPTEEQLRVSPAAAQIQSPGLSPHIPSLFLSLSLLLSSMCGGTTNAHKLIGGRTI